MLVGGDYYLLTETGESQPTGLFCPMSHERTQWMDIHQLQTRPGGLIRDLYELYGVRILRIAS